MYNQKKFSVNDVYQNSFYQIPSFFFLEDFPKVSDKAIIIYSLLKSRHELSIKNKWFDKEGNVFLIMRREEMEKTLRSSDKTITKAINELKEFNLLIEVRQGKGRPNLIYLTYPDIDQIIKDNKNEELIDFNDMEKVDSDNLFSEIEKEQPVEVTLTVLEEINTESETSLINGTIENTMNRKSYDSTKTIENTMKCKNYTSLNEIHSKSYEENAKINSNTPLVIENTMNRNIYGSRYVNITPLNIYIYKDIYLQKNHSFIQKDNEANQEIENLNKVNEGMNENINTNSEKIETAKIKKPKKEIVSDEMIRAYTQLVHENIDYDILVSKHENDIVNEITQILIETLCSTKFDFRINGCPTSSNLVKTRFKNLNHMHIEFVIDCLSRNTTEIRDIRSYLMTTLYNAPTSMSLYYKSKVNFDLNN